MVISHGTKIQVVPLAVTDAMATAASDALNWKVDQATADLIQQPRTEVTEFSFAASNKEITNSILTDQN